MFKTFIKKPIKIKAFQFTAEMHEAFCKRGTWDDNNNPTEVQFDFIKNYDFQWNQHTKTLLIDTGGGLMNIEINDWIVKNPLNKQHPFYAIREDVIKNSFDEVIK